MGDVIFEEGSYGEIFYMIKSGSVSVTIKDKGEVAMLVRPADTRNRPERPSAVLHAVPQRRAPRHAPASCSTPLPSAVPNLPRAS
jgi:hypothetical protein